MSRWVVRMIIAVWHCNGQVCSLLHSSLACRIGEGLGAWVHVQVGAAHDCKASPCRASWPGQVHVIPQPTAQQPRLESPRNTHPSHPPVPLLPVWSTILSTTKPDPLSSFLARMMAVISTRKLCSSPLFHSVKVAASSSFVRPPMVFRMSYASEMSCGLGRGAARGWVRGQGLSCW